MRLPSYRILWRGVLDANRNESALGRVFEFPCIMNFCPLFLIFAAKKSNYAGSLIRARDQRIVHRKIMPLRRDGRAIKLR
jgi:hypothetical protein